MSYNKIRPPSRSRVIDPPTKDWPNQGILGLGDLPSAAGTVIDKGIFPQLLRQGIGQRGSVHMVEHYAQNYPRVKELREKIATRLETVRERVKSLRGQRIRDPQPWGHGQIIQATPWGPRNWPREEGVGGLPSVASLISGPARSMYAMLGRQSSNVGDGRDISIHSDQDDPPEANLATEISVQVE